MLFLSFSSFLFYRKGEHDEATGPAQRGWNSGGRWWEKGSRG
jgi:hypothetical protein